MDYLEDYLRRQRELYDAFLRPSVELRKAQEMYEEMQRPYRQLQELMQPPPFFRELEEQRKFQEKMFAETRAVLGDLNTTSSVAAALGAVTPLSTIEEQRRMLSQLGMPASFQATIDAVRGMQPSFLRVETHLEELMRSFGRYAGERPEVPEQGTLVEVQARVAAIVSSQRDEVSEVVSAFLHWLATNARRIGPRGVSFIILTIVYPLLLTVYQDELKKVVHQRRPAQHRQVQRELAKAITERVPRPALDNLRYVRADHLNVRSASRRKSGIVGTLSFGDVVMVMRETKDWTLIEFQEGEVTIRGWVLSRYLARFKS
jgi:hypothetical protein